jgi:hypothetical protein
MLVLLLLLTPVLANNVQAQDVEKRRPSFDRANSIGFGGGYKLVRTYDRIRYSPALILYYEHTAVNILGPGLLNIGAELGIYRFQQIPPPNSFGEKMAFAIRATYHFTVLKNMSEGLDPYLGLAAGLYSSSETEIRFTYQPDPSTKAFLAPFVGIKYNFKPNFGIWAEGGTDITYGKLGLNFNF